MFHTEYRVPEGYVKNNTEVTFWKVPQGITLVHICLVGGGGSGGSKYGGGGNGGNLLWINDVVVTPGTYIEVGAGLGGRCVSALTNEIQFYGGDSYYGIWNQYAPVATPKLAIAKGGLAGTENTSYGTAGGGAGAAGYTGTTDIGGFGGSVSNSFMIPDPSLVRQSVQPVNLIPTSGIGTNGSNNGGQGGQGSKMKSSTTAAGLGFATSAGGGSGAWSLAKGGGGIGIYGSGARGLAGRAVASGGSGLFVGNGGSNGQNGKIEGAGGDYGGGGAGSRKGGPGGLGAVRILWGAGRSWPSTLVADQPITDTTGQVLIVPQVIPATSLIETYNLTGPTTANEGTTVTFTLTATNVYRASLQWTTTGVTTGADYATGTLTSGNIEIDTTTSPYTTTITFPISNDNLTEGAEELTVKVRIFKDNLDGTFTYEDACSATVSILDTSRSQPTYAFAAPYNVADSIMNEGTTYPVTINTTWVPHGTILYWSIRNSTSIFDDFTGDLFGNGVVTQTSFITLSDGSTVTKEASAIIQITPKPDLLTEGPEYFYIDLRLNSQSDPAVILSSPRIAIGDTSVASTIIAPARLDVYEYAGSWTFSIGTTGYPVGTTLYWQVVHGSTNDADFVGPLNGPLTLFDVQGSIRGSGRLGIIIEDNKTEGTETFSIIIKSSAASTVILATIPCTISDTSLDPVFTFFNPPISINEGTTYTYNISCTAPITTNLFYSVTGPTANPTSDFTGSVGINGFSMTSGTGGFELTPKADTTTEGPETFIIKIYRSTADYFANKPVATSPTITINDTSQDPLDCTLFAGSVSVIGSLTGGLVYGSNPYTTDSDWNVAAVHAGLVGVGESAVIQKILPAADTNFPGSVSNGVTTLSKNSNSCGVVITRAIGTLSGVCTATAVKSIFNPSAGSSFRFTTSSSGCIQTAIPYTMGGGYAYSYDTKRNDAPAGVFTGNVDDGYWNIDLGFSISFLGTTYTNIFVGTNGYVTFGGGSTVYAGLNYASPAFPKILIAAADNSCQNINFQWLGLKNDPSRNFYLRWEGTNDLHYRGPLGFDEPGDPNIAWEMRFYSSPNNQIDLHVEKNARAP
jgi:hypothetical protein